MSIYVIGAGLLAGPFILKKFNKELEELGLSKRDIKIITVIVVLYLLRRDFKKQLIKTKSMITTRYLQFERVF